MNRREFGRLAVSFAGAGALASWRAGAAARGYQPKFPALWDEVYASIQQDWKSDAVHSAELPRPFMAESPGWNFSFYWDNYFMNLGLLRLEGYQQFARDAADNLLALVERMGYVPNCNLSWGVNRSQPPYLSPTVREVYAVLPDKEWLHTAYMTLLKEYAFWMDEGAAPIESHATGIAGLARYSHHASRRELLEFYDGALRERFGFATDLPELQKLEIANRYVSEAASGMDFTTRFEHRCNDFAAVDLSTLLYLYEENFLWMERELGLKPTRDWRQAAEARRAKIQRYFWNEQRGFYFDYDLVQQRHGLVASCAGFLPLWAGIPTPRQAARITEFLPVLECEWGLAACEQSRHEHVYQWDYPVGWPPDMALGMLALERAGYHSPARRIAAKFLDLVAANYDKPVSSNALLDQKTVQRSRGHLFEKYEVTTGKISDSEYPAFAGRCWTAGVFVYAYQLVKQANQRRLHLLSDALLPSA